MKVGPQFPLKGGQERLWQRGLPEAVEDLVEDVEPVLLLHLLLLRPRVLHLRRIRRPDDAARRERRWRTGGCKYQLPCFICASSASVTEARAGENYAASVVSPKLARIQHSGSRCLVSGVVLLPHHPPSSFSSSHCSDP
ncbi:hypothetical protein BHM03_00015888 [Ensete ventricosum]|nr:hypothetical protein BHM03_00015888 [Ensete ventricosum]